MRQSRRLGAAARQRITALREELEALERRRRLIAYVDPVDIRFNRFEPQPVPNASAVMFCLMDVSGSMGEREKDLAKRFFVLLHLFLKRRYERIEIVFIRHTHEAQEVDEETFFYSHAKRRHGRLHRAGGDAPHHRGAVSQPRVEHLCRPGLGRRQSGERLGTLHLAPERAASCAFASISPMSRSSTSARRHIFGSTDNGTTLWRAYRTVDARWPNFQMTRIAKPNEIYPVFRKLFAKQPAAGQMTVCDAKART